MEWGRLKAHELRRLAAEDTLAIIPVASIEQHGPHLPVQVDMLLAAEVARRTTEHLPDSMPTVVTPVVWSGLAEHHMPYGGTITLDFAAFSALIGGVCRSLTRQGFRRLCLLNGHGGNTAALKIIAGELEQALAVPVVVLTYWEAAGDAFASILERQTTVRHACEAETSMMLALAPDLVDTSRLEEAVGPDRPELSEAVGPGIYRWQAFTSRTASGVIGDARPATAEKGERLLDAAAAAIAQALTQERLWEPRPDAPQALPSSP